jgi:hypothetical protein
LTRARENADGGLVLIGTANPSAASSIKFTNLTSGKNYRVVGNLSRSTAGVIYFRFTENTVDKSTNYYGANFFTGWDGTSGNIYPSNLLTEVTLGVAGTSLTAALSFSYDLNVQSASGRIYGNNYSSHTSRAQFGGFSNEAMSSFNGINIFPASGTATGQIKLYEYR